LEPDDDRAVQCPEGSGHPAWADNLRLINAHEAKSGDSITTRWCIEGRPGWPAVFEFDFGEYGDRQQALQQGAAQTQQ